MRKLLVFLLTAVMAVAMTACSGNTKENNDGQKEEQNAPEIADALEVLTKVWAAYAEEEKFPVGGGDSANISFEGPAKFSVEAVEELDATLGLPADLAGQIDDAASMMHAMMANNFTAGVYHLTDPSKMDDFTTTLKDSLLAKQWLCGSPEKVMILTVGDYVVSAYGMADLLETFKTKLTAEYPTAAVVCEENIV